MSLHLASKYVFPSHIHLGDFSGFRIISFNNHVNVTWDDERVFNQKFGTFSIPRDFHFLDLANTALSSSTFMFPIPVPLLSHFLSPYSLSSLQTYLQAFFSPHIPFQNFFTLSLDDVSFTITFFSLFFYRFFWHPSGRFHFACKICYVYEILFSSVLSLVLFALVPF